MWRKVFIMKALLRLGGVVAVLVAVFATPAYGQRGGHGGYGGQGGYSGHGGYGGSYGGHGGAYYGGHGGYRSYGYGGYRGYGGYYGGWGWGGLALGAAVTGLALQSAYWLPTHTMAHLTMRRTTLNRFMRRPCMPLRHMSSNNRLPPRQKLLIGTTAKRAGRITPT